MHERAEEFPAPEAECCGNRVISLEAHDVCACIYKGVARALNYAGGMGVGRHQQTANQTREQAARDHAIMAGSDPRPCAICGEITARGSMCGECAERARPYQPDDPYDDLGGEN